MKQEKILILSEGNKISGPNTWKNGLIATLLKHDYRIQELNTASYRSIIKLEKILDSDIIHAYHISGSTILFLLGAKAFGIKSVFTLHGNYYKEASSKKGIKKIL